MVWFQKHPAPEVAPIEGVGAVLFDLDGVVYKGPLAVPGAIEAILALEEHGMRVGYITNNASRTDATVAAQLRDLGLDANPEDVVTSAQAAVAMLRDRIGADAVVLVVGGEGLTVELDRVGIRYTRSADDAPAAVVQGFAPEVAWTDLAEASYALGHAGIPWIATNQDWTIPKERGIAPGNGTLVSAVHTASGRLPEVAGKPERPLFDLARRRFGVESAIMVGDRLDTDIKGARAAGLRSAFVLTGVDRPKQLIAAGADERPDFILRDIAGLEAPYPEVRIDEPGPDAYAARVRRAKVRLDSTDLTVESAGDDPLDLLRAVCAVVWTSNKMAFALNVPESLTRDATYGL